MIKQKGFSLVELMMVVAVIAIVAVGLNSFFTQTLNAWWRSQNQMEVSKEMRVAKDRLGDDLRSVRRATINNLLLNPGLMDPLIDGGQDVHVDDSELTHWTWWEGNAPAPGTENWDNTGLNMENRDNTEDIAATPADEAVDNFFHSLSGNERNYDRQSIEITALDGARRYEWRSETIGDDDNVPPEGRDRPLNVDTIVFGGFLHARFLNNNNIGVQPNERIYLIANINDPTPDNATLNGWLFPLFWTLEEGLCGNTGILPIPANCPACNGTRIIETPVGVGWRCETALDTFSCPYQWVGGVVRRRDRDIKGNVLPDEDGIIDSVQLVLRVSGCERGAIPEGTTELVHGVSFDNLYLGTMDRDPNEPINVVDGDGINELGEGVFAFAQLGGPEPPPEIKGKFTMSRRWVGENVVWRCQDCGETGGTMPSPEDCPACDETNIVEIPVNERVGNEPNLVRKIDESVGWICENCQETGTQPSPSHCPNCNSPGIVDRRPEFRLSERGVEIYVPFNVRRGNQPVNVRRGNQPGAPMEMQTTVYPRVR